MIPIQVQGPPPGAKRPRGRRLHFGPERPITGRDVPERPITGRDVFVMLIAFFSLVLLANATLVVFALHSMPGLDDRNAYEAGVRFNRELEAAARQEARGWRLSVRNVDTPGASLIVEARDGAGQGIDGLDIRAMFRRPTDARLDQTLGFTGLGLGRYQSPSPALAAGQWDLVLEAARDGERLFRSRQRISAGQ